MATDYTTALGQVRLKTADLDEAAPVISDEILTGYLVLNNQNVNRAAADALDAMATSASMMDRKLRSQDVATDGPATAADLRKRAAGLRAAADAEDAKAETSSYFELIPFGPDCGYEAAERGFF